MIESIKQGIVLMQISKVRTLNMIRIIYLISLPFVSQITKVCNIKIPWNVYILTEKKGYKVPFKWKNLISAFYVRFQNMQNELFMCLYF